MANHSDLSAQQFDPSAESVRHASQAARWASLVRAVRGIFGLGFLLAAASTAIGGHIAVVTRALPAPERLLAASAVAVAVAAAKAEN